MARHDRAIGNAGLQAVRDLTQDFITRLNTEKIIDGFEAVYIGDADREGRGVAGAFACEHADLVPQTVTVAEPRQRVAVSHRLQLVLADLQRLRFCPFHSCISLILCERAHNAGQVLKTIELRTKNAAAFSESLPLGKNGRVGGRSGLQPHRIRAENTQENRLDHVRADGFQQHVVHSGRQAFVEIALEGVGDDPDDGNVLVPRQFTHAAGDLETVDIGECRVEQDDGRRLLRKSCKASSPEAASRQESLRPSSICEKTIWLTRLSSTRSISQTPSVLRIMGRSSVMISQSSSGDFSLGDDLRPRAT